MHINRQLEQTAGKFASLYRWNVTREHIVQVDYSMINELARPGQSRREANEQNAVRRSYEVKIKESPDVTVLLWRRWTMRVQEVCSTVLQLRKWYYVNSCAEMEISMSASITSVARRTSFRDVAESIKLFSKGTHQCNRCFFQHPLPITFQQPTNISHCLFVVLILGTYT